VAQNCPERQQDPLPRPVPLHCQLENR
jgi:hypothetical protein